MCCEPFGETQVQLSDTHTSQETLRDLDGPFSVLGCIIKGGVCVCRNGFLCATLCSCGSLCAGMYLCWQQANKGGVVCVNAKMAPIKYDCV